MHRIWSVVDNWGSIAGGGPVPVDGGESPLPPFVFLLVFDCIGYSCVIA